MTLTLMIAIQFFTQHSSLWWYIIIPSLLKLNGQWFRRFHPDKAQSVNWNFEPCCDQDTDDSHPIFSQGNAAYDDCPWNRVMLLKEALVQKIK